MIAGDDLRQLLRVVAFIQLGAADQCDAVFDKGIVKVPEGIGRTVGGNQQICPVKIGGENRSQFDLYRPLDRKSVV